MADTYRCIDVEQVGDVFLARVHEGALEEPNIRELGKELTSLIDSRGCRKLVVSFGDTECLYSALIAQLLTTRKAMQLHSGRMKLCDVPPMTRDVFRVCKLEDFFEFAPSMEQALKVW